jgi:hypothetical protein
MAITIIRRLTIKKAQHPIQLIAKDFGFDEKPIRNILQKKGINCYKKKIPMTQEENVDFAA